MSLFNPWVLLGIIMSVMSAFGGGYFKGKHDEHTRQQIEIAALNVKARETEQAMAQVAQTYGQTLRRANNAAKAKEDKLRADIASGTLSLRIPVKTQCAVPASGDATAAAGGDSGTASAELDRSTAEALIAITAEGDTDIRKLNTCIQTYEQMRTMK